MQNNRTRVVWIVAIAVAFVLFIDPFNFFRRDRVPAVRADRQTEAEMDSFMAASASAPEAILDLFNQADVVLLGESGYFKQHVDLVADLIEPLDNAGIRFLGYQYANREEQDRIDRLVTGSSFDESEARRILFDHLSVLGYEEHINVFRSAWEVNRRKAEGEEPFHIVALSNRLDYTAIATQEDLQDAAAMKRVFATGIPDVVMAEIIGERFLDPGMKALVFAKIEHALTGFTPAGFTEQLADLGFPRVSRAGNALRSRYGSRVVTAALHGPVRSLSSRTGLAFPASGLVDNAARTLEDGRRVGFRTAESPFAEVRVTGDIVPDDLAPPPTLSDFCELYVVTAPITDLVTVTPIEDFITEDNLADAIRTFPGPDPGQVSAENLNEFIAGNVRQLTEAMRKFR